MSAARRRPIQPTELGRIVREARMDRGLTQEELAEAVGRSQEWVGKVESGEIERPRDNSIQLLARVLSLDVADLFVAMNRAQTKAAAQRIAESLPHLDPEDPTLDLLMDGARRLSPAGRKALLRQLETIADLQRQWEEDAARDGL